MISPAPPPVPRDVFALAAQRLAEQPWSPEPHQVAPAGDWLYWLLVAGRGSGKTDAGAHYVDQHASGPACLSGSVPHRIAIAAPTLGDARETCVKGDSGLLAHNPSIRFIHGDGLLTWPNGARGRIFGAYTPEDVERWRGPQHCLVWGDELAAWPKLVECWDQMRLGLRLGLHPRFVGTTTPKPKPRLKTLMADPRTALTKARTRDNPHLAPDVQAVLHEQYQGSRLGRQELDAEVLDDIEGAYWTREEIDLHRVVTAPELERIVVAIDPAVTTSDDSDETGIAAAGRSKSGERCPACGEPGPHYFVLRADGYRVSPATWARKAIDLYDELKADRIVAEINNGGDMVNATLRQVRSDVPLSVIHASRGKSVRAEPISALYEQGRVHHVGSLKALEDQQCSFPVANDHDDLIDAVVYAISKLKQQRVVLGVSKDGRITAQGVAA